MTFLKESRSSLDSVVRDTIDEQDAASILRATIRVIIQSGKREDLMKIVNNILTWGCAYHNLSVLPEIRFVEGRLLNMANAELMAGFQITEKQVPEVYFAINHPAVEDDPLQLPFSVFHEIQHYLDWKQDPASYNWDQKIQPTDPVELDYDRKAAMDMTPFLLKWTIGKICRSGLT